MLRFFYILFLVICFIGCQTVFNPWLIKDLSVGMNQEQVIEILGEPSYISNNDKNIVFGYTYSETIKFEPNSIKLNNERLIYRNSNSDFYQNQRSFEIIFLNNKLISHKELN